MSFFLSRQTNSRMAMQGLEPKRPPLHSYAISHASIFCIDSDNFAFYVILTFGDPIENPGHFHNCYFPAIWPPWTTIPGVHYQCTDYWLEKKRDMRHETNKIVAFPITPIYLSVTVMQQFPLAWPEGTEWHEKRDPHWENFGIKQCFQKKMEKIQILTKLLYFFVKIIPFLWVTGK